MAKKPIRMICGTCGSEDVQADAFASWDFATQSWTIDQTFDKGSVCNDCGGDCSIDEIEGGKAFASVERSEEDDTKFHGVVRRGSEIVAKRPELYDTAEAAHDAAEALEIA